jgi:hypothetical protein
MSLSYFGVTSPRYRLGMLCGGNDARSRTAIRYGQIWDCVPGITGPYHTFLAFSTEKISPQQVHTCDHFIVELPLSGGFDTIRIVISGPAGIFEIRFHPCPLHLPFALCTLTLTCVIFVPFASLCLALPLATCLCALIFSVNRTS